MKIAFFTDTYIPQINGVSVTVESTVKALRKAGHTVYVFAPQIPGYKETDRYVIRLKSFKMLPSETNILFPLLLPNKKYGKMLQVPMDIVHAHGNGAFSLLGHRVARMRGVPYVLTFHTLLTQYTHYIFNGRIIRPQMVATAMRMFGNACDGIIVPSEKMEKELRSYGLRKDIEIIPNFIDLSAFHRKKSTFLRKLCSIPENEPIIVSVGRLGKEKNFAFLIKAFRQAVSAYPTAHLVIVGHGAEEKNLKKLISSYKLEHNVHLPGAVSQHRMAEVYTSADIFAFSSYTETQGLAVVEAAASGLPIIALNDEAYKPVVEQGKSGYLLSKNQKQFAEKMKYLLNHPDTREAMGKRSHEVCKEYYSSEHIIRHLVSYYEQVQQHVSKTVQKRRFSTQSFKILTQASDVVEKFFR